MLRPKRLSAVKARLRMVNQPRTRYARSGGWRCCVCSSKSAAYDGGLSCNHVGWQDLTMCMACARTWYVDSGKFARQKALKCFGCKRIMDYADHDMENILSNIVTPEEREERIKNLSIKPSQLDKSLKHLYRNGLLQKCPDCSMVCEKEEGCDTMTCPVCFAVFDYQDGAKAETVY